MHEDQYPNPANGETYGDNYTFYFFCSGTWFKSPLPETAEMRLSNTSNSIYSIVSSLFTSSLVVCVDVDQEVVKGGLTFFWVSLVSVPM